MRYPTPFLFLLFAFAACSDDEVNCDEVQPDSSVFENVEVYYLERDSNVDTLLVRTSFRSPGNQCAGFSFDEVAFNGVTAALDDTVEPPVYVLVE